MKSKLTGIRAALIALTGLTLYSQVAPADEITAVSWGGAFEKSEVEAYFRPFTRKTGIAVNVVSYNGGLAEIKAQVEAHNVSWDIVDLETQDVRQGCDEGILEKINPAIINPGADGSSPADDFITGAITECSVGKIVWSNVVAYDTRRFTEKKPEKIADFFDLQTFPGKRGMRNIGQVNAEWALMADGVPTKDLYATLSTPEGVDRAFAKLDTIKSDVVWWEAGAQPPQLLADGEVVMSTAYNGRIFNAIDKEKQPFAIVWDGQIYNFGSWGIPKGSPKKDLAIELIKFGTSSQPLAEQAKWTAYAPVRKSSLKFVDSSLLLQLPTAPENFGNALQFDVAFWADHADEINERFKVWLTSK